MAKIRNRYHFLKLATILILVIILAASALWFVYHRKSHEKIRNVLLISIDTCRADYLSCYGYTKKTTPNIDTIAEEGMIDKNEIKLDTNLYDLGIDSLSSLEILVALENKYDITIAQNRLKNVNSVRQIVRAVLSALKKKQSKDPVA